MVIKSSIATTLTSVNTKIFESSSSLELTLHSPNMHLVHLLPLASLALALPHTNLFTKRQGDSCISQEWNIQQYTEFTAGSTSPAGGPSAFTDSGINFLFADPNFDIQYSCSAEAETGQSLESIVGNVNFCDGGNMSFQYFGQGSIELQRTDVACGK